MSITFSAKTEDRIRETIQEALNTISIQLAKETKPQKSYTVIFDDIKKKPFCLICAEKISDDLGNGFIVETNKTRKNNSQYCSECKCLLEYKLSEEGAIKETKRFLSKESNTIDLNNAEQCYEIEAIFRAYFPNLIVNKKPRCKDLANLIKLCNIYNSKNL